MVKRRTVRTTPFQRDILWALAAGRAIPFAEFVTALWRSVDMQTEQFLAECERALGVLQGHGAVAYPREPHLSQPTWTEVESMRLTEELQFDEATNSWREAAGAPLNDLQIILTRRGVDMMHMIAERGERKLPEGFSFEPTWGRSGKP